MMWRTTERQCRREVVSRGDADVENAAKGWGADFCALRGEGRERVGGGVGPVTGKRQRTVGGRIRRVEERTAANCWRADFGVRGENGWRVDFGARGENGSEL